MRHMLRDISEVSNESPLELLSNTGLHIIWFVVPLISILHIDYLSFWNKLTVTNMGFEFYTKPQQGIYPKPHFYFDWLRVPAACIKVTASQI